MSDKPLDGYWQNRGKWMVDALYDKGFLDQDLARASFESLEAWFGGVLRDEHDMGARSEALLRQVRDISARRKEAPECSNLVHDTCELCGEWHPPAWRCEFHTQCKVRKPD